MAKTEKLRTAQIRILKALNGSKGALTKSKICDKVAPEFPTAAKFQQWMADPLGSLDPKISKGAEARCGYPSLLTLKFVKHHELDVDGKKEDVYEITGLGKAALAKALEAAKAENKAPAKAAPKAKKKLAKAK